MSRKLIILMAILVTELAALGWWWKIGNIAYANVIGLHPQTYAEAVGIIESAPSGPMELPSYWGGTTNERYLRNWVLSEVADQYGVAPSTFDEPTLASTTILRDFVHRSLYQVDEPRPDIMEIRKTEDYHGDRDVALMYRYPAYGLCYPMAWQLFTIYRALGYRTDFIQTINGPWGEYDDSHVTTQVYVTDLDKKIIQDATFNFSYRDGDKLLSFDEARQANIDGSLTFDGLADYRDFLRDGRPRPHIAPETQDHFRANYLGILYQIWDEVGDGPDYDLSKTG